METTGPRIAALLALAAATAAVAQAESRPSGMLPPEVAKQFYSGHLEGFGEPALWRPEARRGYRSRIRLTITGILYTSAAIRIDERASGRLEGHIAFVDRRDRQSPHGRTESRFPVSRAQMEGLRQSIVQARLWTVYPEFWVGADPEDICLDGMELIFERVDAGGYRFSHANAQCNAPAAMHRVAINMFEIARASQLRRWLR